MFFESAKLLDSRMVFTGICSPERQLFDITVTPASQGDSNRVTYYDGMDKTTKIIHDYRYYYTTIITEKKSILDTSYRLTDTAALHMQATGSIKEFKGRNCYGYEPVNTHYRWFTLWVDTTLPSWVHPCIFWGLDVPGGIVAITFNSGTHTLLLDSIDETGYAVPHIPFYEKPVWKYLPFGKQIGLYDSFQLPD